MAKRFTIAELALEMTGVFEAELLVELMLREWKHPLAGSEEFRRNLLESAAEALHTSIAGEQLIETIPPKKVSLVAAVWYAESTTLAMDGNIPSAERSRRQEWVETVRRSVPSCFCDPDLLS